MTPRSEVSIIDLFREASLTTSSPVQLRLQAASEWCRNARILGHESVLEAYSTSLNLLGVAIARGRSLETRHIHLSTDTMLSRDVVEHLATDAASWAIEQDRVELAVEFLEQGRATILTQIGRYRTPLDDVAKKNPELARRFEGLSRLLDRSIVKGEGSDHTAGDDVAKCAFCLQGESGYI